MLAPKGGHIELITGTMYAGKTSELIRRLNRFRYANYKVMMFTLDGRFDKQTKSHDGISIKSYFIEPGDRRSPNSVRETIKQLNPDVVAFDEIQFLDPSYVPFFKELALEGKKVIVAGLEQDFRCGPFETTTLAFLEAEFVKKLNAVCSCGNLAIRNYRKIDSDKIELEGAEDIYEAKYRECYEKLK